MDHAGLQTRFKLHLSVGYVSSNAKHIHKRTLIRSDPGKYDCSGFYKFVNSSRGIFRSTTTRRGFYRLPFIDRIGNCLPLVVNYWKTTAQRLLFTLISTVRSRLYGALKRRLKENFKHLGKYTITRVAVMCVLSGKKVHRYLNAAGRGIKCLSSSLGRGYHQLESDKKVLYDQLISKEIGSWLQSRSYQVRYDSTESFLDSPSSKQEVPCLPGRLSNIINQWASKYQSLRSDWFEKPIGGSTGCIGPLRVAAFSEEIGRAHV